MGELEGQPFEVFISSAKSGPGFDPCRHEMRMETCLIHIHELNGNGLHRVKDILRMGLDAENVWLKVDDVFGADVTLGLDCLDMKGSRDIVCIVKLGLAGKVLDVRVNIKIVAGHHCVLVIGLESVFVKRHEGAFPDCFHRLCGAGGIKV